MPRTPDLQRCGLDGCRSWVDPTTSTLCLRCARQLEQLGLELSNLEHEHEPDDTPTAA